MTAYLHLAGESDSLLEANHSPSVLRVSLVLVTASFKVLPGMIIDVSSAYMPSKVSGEDFWMSLM